MSANEFLAAVVQWRPGSDVASNRSTAAEWIAAAAMRGATLIVLPEYSQFFHDDLVESAATYAETLEGEFVTALHAAAREHQVTIVAGMLERDGDAVFNTIVAVNDNGVVQTYRKVHLYDAFGMRESDWLSAGDTAQSPVFDVAGQRVGIETCYDLRFPETTRLLVDAGADVVVIPAEWVRGPQKEHHWTTLVTARAIENTVHVLAADHAPPVGAGCSMIVDPMGITLAALGESEGVAVAPVDAARTASVRATNPSLANRRYRVTPLT